MDKESFLRTHFFSSLLLAPVFLSYLLISFLLFTFSFHFQHSFPLFISPFLSSSSFVVTFMSSVWTPSPPPPPFIPSLFSFLYSTLPSFIFFSYVSLTHCLSSLSTIFSLSPLFRSSVHCFSHPPSLLSFSHLPYPLFSISSSHLPYLPSSLLSFSHPPRSMISESRSGGEFGWVTGSDDARISTTWDPKRIRWEIRASTYYHLLYSLFFLNVVGKLFYFCFMLAAADEWGWQDSQ